MAFCSTDNEISLKISFGWAKCRLGEQNFLWVRKISFGKAKFRATFRTHWILKRVSIHFETSNLRAHRRQIFPTCRLLLRALINQKYPISDETECTCAVKIIFSPLSTTKALRSKHGARGNHHRNSVNICTSLWTSFGHTTWWLCASLSLEKSQKFGPFSSFREVLTCNVMPNPLYLITRNFHDTLISRLKKKTRN